MDSTRKSAAKKPSQKKLDYVIAVDEVIWSQENVGASAIATLAAAVPKGWLAYRIPCALIAGFDAGGPSSKSERLHGRECDDPSAVVTTIGNTLFQNPKIDLQVDARDMILVCYYWDASQQSPSQPRTTETLLKLQLQVAAAISAFRRLRSNTPDDVVLSVELRLGEFSFIDPTMADIVETTVREFLGSASDEITKFFIVQGDDPALILADLLLYYLYQQWPQTSLPGGFPNPTFNKSAADTNRYLPPRALARLLARMRPAHVGDPAADGLVEALADELDQHDNPALVTRNLLDVLDRAFVNILTRTRCGLERAIQWCQTLDNARRRTSGHRSWSSSEGFEAQFLLLDIRLRAYNHLGSALDAAVVELIKDLEMFCATQTPPDLAGLEAVLGRFARLGEHLYDQFAFADALKLIRQAETRYRPFAQYVQRQLGITLRPIGTMASNRARLLMALATVADDPAKAAEYRAEAEETLKNDVPTWFANPGDEARRQTNLAQLYVEMRRPLDAMAAWMKAVTAELPGLATVDFTVPGELKAALQRDLPPNAADIGEVIKKLRWLIWVLGRILALDPQIDRPNAPPTQVSLRGECGPWLLDILSAWLNARGDGKADHPWPSIMRDAVEIALAISPTWKDIDRAKQYACRPNPDTPLNRLESASIAANFALSAKNATDLQAALSEASNAIQLIPHAHHIFAPVTNSARTVEERAQSLVERFPRH